MTYVVTTEAEFNRVVAPNLPLATPEYSYQYQDQLNNILRLYFNRLDGLLALLKTSGAIDSSNLDSPNGLFFNTTSQAPAASNTGYPIDFNATYLHNNVDLQTGSTSRVVVSVGGVYNFQFSGQLKSTNSSGKDIYIWITRNGSTISYSSHRYTLSGADNHLNVAWNFDIDLAAGEYIEMYWGATSTAVVLEAVAASAPYPASSSAVLTANFVARLPDPRPTPP